MGSVEETPTPKRTKRDAITFTEKNLPVRGVSRGDPLVIALDLNGTLVRRVLVNTGSSVNVMYHDVFTKLGLSEEQLTPTKTPLAGFTKDVVETEGSITLPVEVGEEPTVKRVEMEFVVVRLKCAHNLILGRSGIARIGGLISMEHLCIKFHTSKGIGTVKGDPSLAHKCYKKACKRIEQEVNTMGEGRDPKKGPKPAVELEEVPWNPSQPDKCVRIGKGLSRELREEIIRVLRNFAIVFAWNKQIDHNPQTGRGPRAQASEAEDAPFVLEAEGFRRKGGEHPADHRSHTGGHVPGVVVQRSTGPQATYMEDVRRLYRLEQSMPT